MCWIFASIVLVWVGVIHRQKTLFVFAVGATYQYGFVPKAVCRAKSIALARVERFAAFVAKIFFFCGVLCRYERSGGK